MVRFKVRHCRRDSILTYASVATEQRDWTEREGDSGPWVVVLKALWSQVNHNLGEGMSKDENMTAGGSGMARKRAGARRIVVWVDTYTHTNEVTRVETLIMRWPRPKKGEGWVWQWKGDKEWVGSYEKTGPTDLEGWTSESCRRDSVLLGRGSHRGRQVSILAGGKSKQCSELLRIVCHLFTQAKWWVAEVTEE